MTPADEAAAVLEQLRRGDKDLCEAHRLLRKVKNRPTISVAEAVEASPHAWGTEINDAAALCGLSASATFTAAAISAVELLENLLASGGLRRPWETFPWQPAPAAPF